MTVKAVGEITGNRTREEDQMDECTFRVPARWLVVVALSVASRL